MTTLPSCKATGAVLVALIAVTFGLANADRADATPGLSSDRHVLRPCLSDEGESTFPCAWFAPGMGNHKGDSFRIYRDGRVKTITHRRAFQLLGACTPASPIVDPAHDLCGYADGLGR